MLRRNYPRVSWAQNVLCQRFSLAQRFQLHDLSQVKRFLERRLSWKEHTQFSQTWPSSDCGWCHGPWGRSSESGDPHHRRSLRQNGTFSLIDAKAQIGQRTKILPQHWNHMVPATSLPCKVAFQAFPWHPPKESGITKAESLSKPYHPFLSWLYANFILVETFVSLPS